MNIAENSCDWRLSKKREHTIQCWMQNSNRSWNDSHDFIIIYSKVELSKWKNYNANIVGVQMWIFDSVVFLLPHHHHQQFVNHFLNSVDVIHFTFQTEWVDMYGPEWKWNVWFFHKLRGYLPIQRATLAIFKIHNESGRYCDGFIIQSVLRLDTTVWTSTLEIHAKKYNRWNDTKKNQRKNWTKTTVLVSWQYDFCV